MDCTSTVRANLLKAGLFERIESLLEDQSTLALDMLDYYLLEAKQLNRPNPLLLLEQPPSPHLFAIGKQVLNERMIIRLCHRSITEKVNIPEVLSYLATVNRDNWDWVKPSIVALQETEWYSAASEFIKKY